MPIYICIYCSGDVLFCCYNVVGYYACRQQVAIILQIEPVWAYFYLKIIETVLLLNFIHLFLLELAVADSWVWNMQGRICWTWLCNVCRYVGKVVELLALYYLYFVYREGSFVFLSTEIPIHRCLGLTVQCCLNWFSHTYSKYWCGSLTSGNYPPTRSSSDSRVGWREFECLCQ